jgi:hypothetical protein
MKTTTEFNTKYKDVLEEGHYGLDINNKAVIKDLDALFPYLIEDLPNFKYSQIKLKFGQVRFYFSCDMSWPVIRLLERALEDQIQLIYDNTQNNN